MSDINFITDGTVERIVAPRSIKQHVEDIRRECLKSKLKHLADDCEVAQDYCRDLMRSGADVSEELSELETTARGLLFVVLLLKLASGKV